MSDIVERLRDPGVEVTREEAADEIERLRDILRECDLALSFMPQPTKTLRALRERVREALGERDD